MLLFASAPPDRRKIVDRDSSESRNMAHRRSSGGGAVYASGAPMRARRKPRLFEQENEAATACCPEPLLNLCPNPVSLWALGSRNCFAGAVFISPDTVHQNEPPTSAPKSYELSGLGFAVIGVVLNPVGNLLWRSK